MVSDGIGDRSNLTITNDYDTLWVGMYKYDAEEGKLEFTEHYSGSNYGDSWYFGYNYPKQIWLTIEKNGTAATCKVYSDASRTTLEDTLQITLQADHTFRYIYGCNTYNGGIARYMVIDVDDLDLQEAVGLDIAIAYHHYRTMQGN